MKVVLKLVAEKLIVWEMQMIPYYWQKIVNTLNNYGLT